MTRVVSIKSSGYQWSSNRDTSWAGEAACKGQSHLFEILPLSPDGSRDKGSLDASIKRKNAANFAEAEEICLNCPVFFECEKDATREDFEFTYRAARIPLGFKPNPRGRPTQKRGPGECKRGHIDRYALRKRGDRQYNECLECRKISDTERRRRLGISERTKIDTCHAGHDNWRVRSDGRRVCKTCVNARAREVYHAKKADKIEE